MQAGFRNRWRQPVQTLLECCKRSRSVSTDRLEIMSPSDVAFHWHCAVGVRACQICGVLVSSTSPRHGLHVRSNPIWPALSMYMARPPQVVNKRDGPQI